MLAERLRALIAFVPGLSVRELERLADLRRGAVQSVLEEDATNPGVRIVGALAVALGCTTDHLILGRPGPKPDEVVAAVAAARDKRDAAPAIAKKKRSPRSAKRRPTQRQAKAA
jgi:hypothetical protein